MTLPGRESVKGIAGAVFALGLIFVFAKTCHNHPLMSVAAWITIPVFAKMLSRKAILNSLTLAGLHRVRNILMVLVCLLSLFIFSSHDDPFRDIIGTRFVQGYAHWRAEPDWDENGQEFQPEDNWTADTRAGRLGLELLGWGVLISVFAIPLITLRATRKAITAKKDQCQLTMDGRWIETHETKL